MAREADERGGMTAYHERHRVGDGRELAGRGPLGGGCGERRGPARIARRGRGRARVEVVGECVPELRAAGVVSEGCWRGHLGGCRARRANA